MDKLNQVSVGNGSFLLASSLIYKQVACVVPSLKTQDSMALKFLVVERKNVLGIRGTLKHTRESKLICIPHYPMCCLRTLKSVKYTACVHDSASLLSS